MSTGAPATKCSSKRTVASVFQNEFLFTPGPERRWKAFQEQEFTSVEPHHQSFGQRDICLCSMVSTPQPGPSSHNSVGRAILAGARSVVWSGFTCTCVVTVSAWHHQRQQRTRSKTKDAIRLKVACSAVYRRGRYGEQGFVGGAYFGTPIFLG